MDCIPWWKSLMMILVLKCLWMMVLSVHGWETRMTPRLASTSSADHRRHQRHAQSRRSWIKNQCQFVAASATIMGGLTISPTKSLATNNNSNRLRNAATTQPEQPTTQAANRRNEQQRPFSSAAFTKKEYTNSIVASRDTNISPLEVYETLQTQLKRNNNDDETATTAKDVMEQQQQQSSLPRALDVGAGAGVSTQVLYEKLGYKNIDAVDWSGDAWRINVVENGYCPSTVSFYELDDERFLQEWKKQGLDKYDVIAFNFAINEDKAFFFSHNLLKKDGLLLAPINTQQDYWLKQTYQLIDSTGRMVWSANDVGAWSVQFQPDVTQPTCQGIWCSTFNGFQRLGTVGR